MIVIKAYTVFLIVRPVWSTGSWTRPTEISKGMDRPDWSIHNGGPDQTSPTRPVQLVHWDSHRTAYRTAMDPKHHPVETSRRGKLAISYIFMLPLKFLFTLSHRFCWVWPMIGRTGSLDRYQVWTGPTDQSTDLWTRPDWSIRLPGLDWTSLVGPNQSIIWTSLVGRTIKNTGWNFEAIIRRIEDREFYKKFLVLSMTTW